MKIGKAEDAGKVFEKILEQDVIDWNALASGYMKNGRVDEAVSCGTTTCFHCKGLGSRWMFCEQRSAGYAFKIGIYRGCQHSV